MSDGDCVICPFSAYVGYLHPCSLAFPPYSFFPLYNFIPSTFLYLSMTVRFPGSLPWVYNIFQVVHLTDFCPVA